MNTKKEISILQLSVAFVLLLCSITSCHYSFTGASIPPDVKTFNIKFFTNRSANVQPTLSAVFTQKLKDKFLSSTSLSPSTSNADFTLEGYISDYNVVPTAIQSGTDQAALNRLTITVTVKFTNAKDPKQNFETPFSRFADFSSSKTLTEVETNLISDISNQLVDDIFNKAVINW